LAAGSAFRAYSTFSEEKDRPERRHDQPDKSAAEAVNSRTIMFILPTPKQESPRATVPPQRGDRSCDLVFCPSACKDFGLCGILVHLYGWTTCRDRTKALSRKQAQAQALERLCRNSVRGVERKRAGRKGLLDKKARRAAKRAIRQ
jgi:hypothetical protein